MAELTVRYFAAARAAAGTGEESIVLPDGARLDDALAVLGERHPGKLTEILPAASFLLDGVAVRRGNASISGSAQLDVLPPFAGG